jgi:hypothetical protein
VHRQIFVIDVAGGDKVPRKGGPGITRSDLLVINKTDLGPAGRGGPGGDGSGPALVGDWRAVASLLVVGNAPGGRTVRRPDGQAAALSLAGGDATLVSAMAVDHPALRSLLDATVVQPPQLLP